jgi:ATP-dependent Clp protease ATP-binding subunit ClpA
MKYTSRASVAIFVAGLKALQQKRSKISPENILEALLSQYDSTALKLLSYAGGDRNAIYLTLRTGVGLINKRSIPDLSTPITQADLNDLKIFLEQYSQQDHEEQRDYGDITLNTLWSMASAIIEIASKEVRTVENEVLGTEHLLIAVAKSGGLAQQVLNDHGIHSQEL